MFHRIRAFDTSIFIENSLGEDRMIFKRKKHWIPVFGLCLLLFISGCSKEELLEVKEEVLTQAENAVEKTTDNGIGEETETDVSLDVPRISEGKYAYECLAEDVRQVYDEVLYVILEQQESIMVSTLDEKVLDQAYQAVNADYGGLFWVSGYSYTQYMLNNQMTGMEFSPKYTMTYEEREAAQAQIDVSVEQMLSGISVTDSDYDKVKYVYETLIQNVDYVIGAENNQNIISVFLNRQTVCQGYACATQYLLDLLEIPSVIVTGTANGEAHAWNMVLLDGEYYYLDTTWGNSTYTDSQEAKFINYDYLNVTTAEITKSHTIITDFFLPECTATIDNYYVKAGLYFTDWYPEEIGALYKNAWENGTGNVAVKFADAALYEKAKEYFITDQHLGDFCKGLQSFYYLENPDQNILTVTFS